jgi:hypothetical protein
MQNKKYIAPLITGFAAGVLSVVPVLKSLGCCLMLPLAAYFSIYLDIKANGNHLNLTIQKGIVFGLITGLTAAITGTFFDFAITFITHQNDIITSFAQLQAALNSFPIDEKTKVEVIAILTRVVENIRVNGFSAFYTLSLFFSSLFTDIIFGMLGGIIGVQILKRK